MELRIFKETYNQKLYKEMGETKKSSIKDVLVGMQTDRGTDKDTAEQIATSTMLTVSGIESVRQNISDDISNSRIETVNKLFADIEQCKDSETRKSRYQKLYFNLIVHYDEKAMESLAKGTSLETIFWQYRKDNRLEGTEKELQDAIRDAVANYDIPDSVLKSLAGKFRNSKGYFATAKNLGEFGYNLKCIATLDLFLSKKDAENEEDRLTIEDAANIACNRVEIQAAAESVSKSQRTSEVAKKILIVAGITLAIVGVAVAIYYTGQVATFTKAANAVFKYEVPPVFADLAGNTTRTMSYEWLYKPLADAAKTKEVISLVTAAVGAVVVKFSPAIAEFIGKIRAGVSGVAGNSECVAQNGDSIADGLECIADNCSTTWDAAHSEHTELLRAKNQLTQKATVKA